MSLSPQEISYYEQHAGDDQSWTIIGFLIAFTIVGLVSASGRFISRPLTHNYYGVDDYFLLAGVIFLIANSVVGGFQAHYGIGKHVTALTPESSVQLAKWGVANIYTSLATLTTVKLSLLTLYGRIFTLQSTWFRWGFWILVVYIVAWCISFYFAYGFICYPIESEWDLQHPCMQPDSLNYAAQILSNVHDVATFLLPQPLVWGLNCSVKRKVGISVVVAMGLLATMVGIVKTIFIAGPPNNGHSEDTTYNDIVPLICTCVEPSIAILAASLPTFPGLFSHVKKRYFSRFFSNLSTGPSRSKTYAKEASGSRAEDGEWLNMSSRTPDGERTAVASQKSGAGVDESLKGHFPPDVEGQTKLGKDLV